MSTCDVFSHHFDRLYFQLNEVEYPSKTFYLYPYDPSNSKNIMFAPLPSRRPFLSHRPLPWNLLSERTLSSPFGFLSSEFFFRPSTPLGKLLGPTSLGLTFSIPQRIVLNFQTTLDFHLGLNRNEIFGLANPSPSLLIAFLRINWSWNYRVYQV